MSSAKTQTPPVIDKVTPISAKKIRIPVWAIKTTFINDEERERFIASVGEGYTPIHVAECAEERGAYEIVDGVHRFEALQSFGVQVIPCYNHGVKPTAERKALAVRFAWNFSRNNQAFAEALRDIQEFDATFLNWSPLDATELNRLIAELNTDIDLFSGDEEEEAPYVSPTPKRGEVTKTKSLKSVECPHCGKRFNF